eukprot:c15678_g1_i1 orf=26-1078(+)
MDFNGGYPVISYLLQQTLRHLCTDSDWIYAVFWRILPRNYPPPKWDSESSFFDRSKGNKRNWILVWEDGFCDFVACARSSAASEPNSSNSSQNSNSSGYFDHYYNMGDDMHYMQPELFFKMSHEVYNFGEGLIGKVAADNSHKWVYKEPLEGDAHDYPSSWAQGALDPHPRTWEAQFRSGVETIAIVAVKEGVIQLGSLKKTCEDLNFVLFLQRKFNYLQSIPGVFAVHPALTQHAALSKKASAAAAWPSDQEPDQHASEESWPLDNHDTRHVPRKSFAPAEEVDFYGMTNHCVPHQLDDPVHCGQQILLHQASANKQLPRQVESPASSVVQTSLHALLSRLPSVTCRRS